MVLDEHISFQPIFAIVLAYIIFACSGTFVLYQLLSKHVENERASTWRRETRLGAPGGRIRLGSTASASMDVDETSSETEQPLPQSSHRGRL